MFFFTARDRFDGEGAVLLQKAVGDTPDFTSRSVHDAALLLRELQAACAAVRVPAVFAFKTKPVGAARREEEFVARASSRSV